MAPSTRSGRRLIYPLSVHLSTVFLGLMLAISVALGILAHAKSSDIIRSMSNDNLDVIAKLAVQKTATLFAPARSAVDLLAAHPIGDAVTSAGRRTFIPFLIRALEQSPAIASVYLATDEGDFLLARRLPAGPDARRRFSAPDGTAYVIQSLEQTSGRPPEGRYLYLSADRRIIEDRNRPDYTSFDPRFRPWYEQARRTAGMITTDPYVFFSTRVIGATVARTTTSGQAVVGADIALKTLGEVLTDHQITPGTESVLLTAGGWVAAHSDPTKVMGLPEDGGGHLVQNHISDIEAPVIEAAFYGKGEHAVGTPYIIPHQGRDWETMVAPVPIPGGGTFWLALAIPRDELLSDATAMLRHGGLVMAAIIVVALALVMMAARMVSQPIRKLVREADAIRQFSFDDKPMPHTFISDVEDLVRAVEMMKKTIVRFLEISAAVAGEQDFDQLLPLLLDETIATTETEGGVIYLLSQDEERLEPHSARRDGRRPLDIDVPTLALADDRSVAVRCIGGSRAQTVEATAEELEYLGLSGIAEGMDSLPRQLLAVPLFNRAKDLVGVLLLLRSRDISPALVGFTEALSTTAAVSIEARQLIVAQKELFDAFIKLIAGAIDTKSPYTGAHCARVPVLTTMLAEAAAASTDPALRDFTLDADKREAIQVASWLHDCGKVTTPEYVVDKATKLETKYNRIHELRTRFEVLKRDAIIADLKQRLAARGDDAPPESAVADRLDELDDDFAFVASCNIGGEALEPKAIERLRAIGTRTWSRTLDDRLGLSRDEERRRRRFPAPPLPVTEPLLVDRPEQVIPHGDTSVLFGEDNKYGFRVTVPEHRENHGELHNLTIPRGTLTREERFQINDHIVQSIVMLSQLPFPRHLREVPELAGGHHEKMDGSGYPKGLAGHEMSLVARMMAIADIFEALTASDRPYKKGKTLTQSLEIMARMCRENHIDTDLFVLFLRSGVYRRYAETYLKSEQIDVTDIEAFIPPTRTA